MKRRTIDPSKLRRPLKRSRITESIYGSVFLYVRFFLVWIMVLTADFLLEFRFEYLWPFWLLLRSAYDSFKYQGLAFSLLFLTLAFCSDLICLVLLPVHWLFFAASTYVWVQFVWHTDRGLCLPTISLWLLFVYVEASVRLRELKNLPFHLDLCRPFAAHCIGYPVVTLGYGVKSYVGYKMRQRKMQQVAKENEFYMQLINEALPSELNNSGDVTEKSSKALCNGHTPHGDVHLPRGRSLPLLTNGINTKNDLELLLAQEASRRGLKLSDLESTAKLKGNHSLLDSFNSYHSKKHSEDHNLNELDKLTPNGGADHKATGSRVGFFSCGKGSRKVVANGRLGEKVKFYDEDGDDSDSDSLNGSSSSFSSRKNSRSNSPKGVEKGHSDSPSLFSQLKEEKSSRRRAEAVVNQLENTINQFESDNKRLKVELQASRQCELELRSSFNSLMANERSAKIELQQLKSEQEALRQKYQTLNTAKQQDRNTISSLERKLKTERDSRLLTETQLRDERRKQKADEAAQKQRDDAGRHESCIARRTELEDESRQLRSLLQEKEEDVKRLTVENELFKKKHKENDGLQLKKETEVLMSALTAMQGKNTHLENSLSSETRLKLDLFSALGDTRRQLEIAQGKLASKDKEIEALKAKIAEVMAVMPASSYPNMSPTSHEVSGLTCLNPTAPCYVPAVKKNGIL